MRLQKYLAECGLASRRKAEELITCGRVSVNGKTALLGESVEIGDEVLLDGLKVLPPTEKVYIMLNKPEGVVTTSKDQFGRKTVLDLVDAGVRVFPVGRLDYDTSGLLLLTNDGGFANWLAHPSHSVNKTYEAELVGTPSAAEIKKFRSGILIDGETTAPAELKIINKALKTSMVHITIHEGRNRQIRKMCEEIGHRVISLKRIAVGSLALGSLPKGQWRMLRKLEVDELLE